MFLNALYHSLFINSFSSGFIVCLFQNEHLIFVPNEHKIWVFIGIAFPLFGKRSGGFISCCDSSSHFLGELKHFRENYRIFQSDINEQKLKFIASSIVFSLRVQGRAAGVVEVNNKSVS